MARAKLVERIRIAQNFEELCAIHGYTPEEHVVRTSDGYLLGIHRLPSKRNEGRIPPGTYIGKPVVYLHHGLLMNSEVWVCLTDEQRILPFVLVERGYDVWVRLTEPFVRILLTLASAWKQSRQQILQEVYDPFPQLG